MSMDEHKAKSAGGRIATDVCPSKRKQLDLTTAREQIEDTTGPEYWRSLEELAGSEEFQEMLHREFPKGASEWLDDFSRRGFLKTMGASLALAGLIRRRVNAFFPAIHSLRGTPDSSCSARWEANNRDICRSTE